MWWNEQSSITNLLSFLDLLVIHKTHPSFRNLPCQAQTNSSKFHLSCAMNLIETHKDRNKNSVVYTYVLVNEIVDPS